MIEKEILPVGIFVRINDNPLKVFARIRESGFSYCQLASPPDEYMYGKDAKPLTRKLLDAMKINDITVNSVFMTFKNQIWKYPEDAMRTIGFVPEETRAERIARACHIGNWAKEIGVDVLAAHAGFILEDQNCALYGKFIDAMREMILFLESNDQCFTFETGQESVNVLKNTIEDIGTSNLGINFDPANLLLYDMDEPSCLVEKLGKYVMHVHCKDGIRPERKGTLGMETPLGRGDTNFAELLRTLYQIGYRGPLTIEREIPPGPELEADIKHAVKLIESIKQEFKV